MREQIQGVDWKRSDQLWRQNIRWRERPADLYHSSVSLDVSIVLPPHLLLYSLSVLLLFSSFSLSHLHSSSPFSSPMLYFLRPSLHPSSPTPHLHFRCPLFLPPVSFLLVAVVTPPQVRLSLTQINISAQTSSFPPHHLLSLIFLLVFWLPSLPLNQALPLLFPILSPLLPPLMLIFCLSSPSCTPYLSRQLFISPSLLVSLFLLPIIFPFVLLLFLPPSYFIFSVLLSAELCLSLKPTQY